jgi:hypothetical protein
MDAAEGTPLEAVIAPALAAGRFGGFGDALFIAEAQCGRPQGARSPAFGEPFTEGITLSGHRRAQRSDTGRIIGWTRDRLSYIVMVAREVRSNKSA